MKSNLDMRKVWFIFIIVGFVGLTIWIVGSAHTASQRPAMLVTSYPAQPVSKLISEEKIDFLLDAWCIAQRFVEQDLKCPRTVKWPWVSYSACTINLGNGRYRCASYFDAQNSFGAMVRTNFVCVVKFTGGTQWQLESLIIR